MDDKILDASCESVILLVMVVTQSNDGTPPKTQNYELP